MRRLTVCGGTSLYKEKNPEHSNRDKAFGKTPEVLLLSMPWTTTREPSLGLAILKSKLGESGISCRVRHLNLLLLRYLDIEIYNLIADIFAFNDFIFTSVLQDGEITSRQIKVLEEMIRKNASRDIDRARVFIDPSNCVEYALHLRNELIPSYLTDCLRVIDDSATMIGFTSLFDQTIPSLAIAKLIKQKHPDKLIVFGGYAMEKPVGPLILQCFPFVDVVAFGECENKIVRLAHAFTERELLGSIPGIAYRDHLGKIRETPPSSQKVNLDESPIPDYHDWFSDLADICDSQHAEVASRVLPIESSRGCWWGEVSHCIFCGIDNETMRYRFKSPGKVKNMLSTLRSKYGCNSFRFSDYILPKEYYKSLLPELAASEDKYLLHWEIKSNVREQEVQLMNRAGVHLVQPGIESFSSSVLNKMGKGVTAIQNVLTIKLLMENGIGVIYNILYGFPYDEFEEYAEMIKLIPRLYHLIPTENCMPVVTVRNSPLHQIPERFGFQRPLVAKDRYEMIFSRGYREEIGFNLEDYCYTFETPYDFDPALVPLYKILRYQVSHWLARYLENKARLSYKLTGNGIEFLDSRYQDNARHLFFSDKHALIYEGISRQIQTVRQLLSTFGEKTGETALQEALVEFESERLIYKEGERVLGLALSEAYYERQAKSLSD